MQCILVGYGLSGQVFHAPLLRATGFEIVAVVVNSPQNRALAQQHLPHAQLCADLSEALMRFDAPLVVIATPTQTHAPLSAQALTAGRHVVVDKPVALTASEFAGLMRLAHEHQRLLIPFQNRRWDADFLTLKSLISDHALGPIMRYEARFDRFNPQVKDRWREHPVPGAGILYDLGPHLIDQAIHLFGAPDWVFASLLTQREGAMIEDGFELVLGFDPSALRDTSNPCTRPYVCLGASQFAAGADTAVGAPRYKVQGRHATWLKHGFDPQEAALRQGQIPSSLAWMSEAEAARGHFIEGVSGLTHRTEVGVGQWPRFYNLVHQAVSAASLSFAQTFSPVAMEDAWLTCAVIDAAFSSHASGARVRLPMFPVI